MPDSQIAEFHALINGSDDDKWSKFSALIKQQLSQQEPKSEDLSSYAIASILYSSFAQRSEMLPKFLDYFQPMLNASSISDPNDEKYLAFLSDMIFYVLLQSIIRRNWKLALQIAQAFQHSPVIKNNVFNFTTVAPDDPDLMIALTTLEYLGYSAYESTADHYSASEFTDLLPADSPQTKKFLKILQELQGRSKLSLIWSINHYSSLDESRKISGGKHRRQRQVLQSVIDDVHNNKESELISRIMQQNKLLSPVQILEILSRSKKSLENILDQESNKESLANPDQVILTQTTVSCPDLGLHSIAMGFWRDNVCFLNRGPVIDKKYGVRVLKVNPEQRKYLLNFALPEYDENSFAGLPAQTLEEIEIYMIQNCTSETHISMRPQTSENCSWICCKGLYFLAVYLHTLNYIEEHRLSIDNPHLVAAETARAAYKFISEQARMTCTKEYLALNTGFPKDQALLSKVFAKLQYPNWSRRGMQPFQAMFETQFRQSSKQYIMSRIIDAIKLLEINKIQELLPLVDTSVRDEENNTPMSIVIKGIAYYGTKDTESFSSIINILKLLIQNGYVDLGDEIKMTHKEYCEHLLQDKDIDPQRKAEALDILRTLEKDPQPAAARK